MSWLSTCVEAARRFDGRFLPAVLPVRLANEPAAILEEHPLVIADVGAAGGVDPRWANWGNLVRLLAFEARSDEVLSDPRIQRFSRALADQPGCRTLHLTRFNQSSSLFPLNLDLLDDFAVRNCFELTGVREIAVDTLDNFLASVPVERPDFLKVDVEGAELEVLRGATAILRGSVLGIRTEVSFAPRFVGGPLFADVDRFLRERGYTLFILNRELMIRRNRLFTPISQPQCVWGDAVYFLSRSAFCARMREAPEPARNIGIVKFLAVLCAYGVHDYGLEIAMESQKAGFIPPAMGRALEESVRRSAKARRTYVAKATLGLAVATLFWALSLLSPQARPIARLYLRRRAGYLFHYLWRTTARGGEEDASVSDLTI